MEEGRGIEPQGFKSLRGFQDRLSPWMLPSENIADCRLPIADCCECVRRCSYSRLIPRLELAAKALTNRQSTIGNRQSEMELSQRLELCYSIYRTDASPSMLGKQLEQVERIELPRTSFADSRLSTWLHPRYLVLPQRIEL